MHELRRTRERSSEEIDVVGLGRSAVTVVGECKWTSTRVSLKVLDDLESYKLPALQQSGVKLAGSGPRIVLFSRAGFKENLMLHAATRDDLELVDAERLVGELSA